MAKALKTIGVIAGAVALVATGVGAFAPAIAAAAGTVSTVASLAATAANIGASLLQKAPPARGSLTQVLVQADAPQPYVMGEGYFAGVLRHDDGYGATLKEVPNPYLGQVVVYSGGGPIGGIAPRIDQDVVSSWYSGFLYTDTQLGACPEASALTPHWAGFPGWDASSKLSGQAAILWNFKFDKDGKRFASGLPPTGAEGQWVKAYDPRLDDTQPGGAGDHRIGDEDTYEWTQNPALHAGTYAFGRYQNGKRVMGGGLPAASIDWAVIAAWANVCDANDWTIFGPVFEPGNRWANLKEIAAAGGAQPIPSANGRLSFRYHAPAVMLDTIGPEDLAEEPVRVTTMASWSERMNTIIPKYTSPEHNWQQIAGEAVSVSTYVTEDGEDKTQEWPFNLVKSSDGVQPAQLAAYKLVDSRELNPIVIPCGPRLRHYRPGDGLAIDLPDYDLVTDAVVLQRRFDPRSMTSYLTLIGVTAAKHAFALGQTATPPPTPALGQTAQQRDELAAAAGDPIGQGTLQIAGSYTRGLAGNITQTVNGDGTVDVIIPNHTRVYANGVEVAVTGATLVLDEEEEALIFYDDPTRAGGTVSYQTTATAADAYFSAAHPDRHFIGYITAPDSAGDGGSSGGSSPPGGGGWNGDLPPTHQP